MRANSGERWGSVSVGLHWTIAGLILLVQLPSGVVMGELGRGPLQNALYFTHKNVGIIVLLLAVVRLAWRLRNPGPALPRDLPGWQAAAARLTHFLLYALIFVMPVSGYLYTAAGGFPVPLLGIVELGGLAPRNKPLADAMGAVHYWSQWLLYLAAAAHVGGALQHHFVRRDDVLRRMLPYRERSAGPATGPAARGGPGRGLRA